MVVVVSPSSQMSIEYGMDLRSIHAQVVLGSFSRQFDSYCPHLLVFLLLERNLGQAKTYRGPQVILCEETAIAYKLHVLSRLLESGVASLFFTATDHLKHAFYSSRQYTCKL